MQHKPNVVVYENYEPVSNDQTPPAQIEPKPLYERASRFAQHAKLHQEETFSAQPKTTNKASEDENTSANLLHARQRNKRNTVKRQASVGNSLRIKQHPLTAPVTQSTVNAQYYVPPDGTTSFQT